MTADREWINSLGGLYVCLPETVLGSWQGGVEEDENDAEELTDYWQAGLTNGVVGTYSVAGDEALILAAGEGSLTYAPQLGLFVQRKAITAANVIEIVTDALPELQWEEAVQWNAGDGLVVFDAVWPGNEVPPDRLLPVPRAAGPVDVHVAEPEPSARWNVRVTLYRLT
ncbi:immunity 21 family protein [Streptomyces sp. RO-S4]|uniref:Imm21 family immunity protein n=1 Tax=unclassified Streptomyces TaxID=2593676 RepID=UPI001E57B079|nr:MULTISPECIES: Imm21 family immunity protein [unclassified Streptomyces]MCO4697437.1 immunity 21 family protein [Streptomyces sp. RO-S4]